MEVHITITVLDDHEEQLDCVTGTSSSEVAPFDDLPGAAFAIALRELSDEARSALDLPPPEPPGGL